MRQVPVTLPQIRSRGHQTGPSDIHQTVEIIFYFSGAEEELWNLTLWQGTPLLGKLWHHLAQSECAEGCLELFKGPDHSDIYVCFEAAVLANIADWTLCIYMPGAVSSNSVNQVEAFEQEYL